MYDGEGMARSSQGILKGTNSTALWRHDSEARHLRSNASKLHDIARHNGGSDLLRGECDQNTVEWT